MCLFPKERLNLILDSEIIYDGKCQNITGQGLPDRLCPVPEVSSAMQCSTVTEQVETFFFFTCKSTYHLYGLCHFNTTPQLTSVEAKEEGFKCHPTFEHFRRHNVVFFKPEMTIFGQEDGSGEDILPLP